jgi:phosphatidate cytidylyltransferase
LALLVADLRWSGGVPGSWLVVPGLVIGWMAAAELLDLLRTTGSRPLGWTVYAGISLAFLAACSPVMWGLLGQAIPANCPLGLHGPILLALAVSLAVAYAGEMRRFEQPGGAVVNLALSVLVIAYIGIPLSFAALLRQFHTNAWGMAALVSVIFVVKWSDTGAYFAGKRFGRRKLSPKLSPGKTVAGGVGGLVAAVVASVIFFRVVGPWAAEGGKYAPQWGGSVVYGLALGVTGVFGDLSESLIKRDVQRKDSSRWLPGLGGALDVLDSLLFSLPAAYACWATGIVGPA